MKIDSKTVTRLHLPDGKSDAIFFDDELTGFGIRLRTSGGRLRRSWIAQYRAHGRTRRMLIGDAAILDAGQARTKAREILARVVLGEDPQGEKAEDRRRESRTLRSIAESFLEVQEAKLRPESYRVTKLYLLGAPYFGALHRVAANQITLADVASRIGAIARTSGTVTAGRARSALSTMYRWAMGEGLLGTSPVNPVIGTNKPQDSTPRDRVLSDPEIAAIWKSVHAEYEYAHVVRLLILTACRREEIGGLRWSEINLDQGTMTLPKERTKNNHAHSLPLPPLALSIIESIPRRISRDHVFGHRGQDGFSSWAKAKTSLDAKLAGQITGPWVLHDLRRTCATRMGDLGIQPHVIEAVLNHYSGHRRGVAGVYNRSPYEREVKQALALWADHVRTLVEGGERKIVPLRA